MTNWKEQFDKQFPEGVWGPRKDFEDSENLYSEMKDFISTEIIEKLIADIPDGDWMPSLHTGGVIKSEVLKQQLRAKWL